MQTMFTPTFTALLITPIVISWRSLQGITLPAIFNAHVSLSVMQEMIPLTPPWTRRLAQQVRSNGVDARIDVFHLRPGFDPLQWMTNEPIQADKVILICDQFYAEKANVLKGGVGLEPMIIQGDMLTQGDNILTSRGGIRSKTSCRFV